MSTLSSRNIVAFGESNVDTIVEVAVANFHGKTPAAQSRKVAHKTHYTGCIGDKRIDESSLIVIRSRGVEKQSGPT